VRSALAGSGAKREDCNVKGGATMMLAYRLLRLVETHSDALATGLLEKTQNSPSLAGYNHNVPPEELKQRVREIYRHLADWLLGKSELDVEKRYVEIGVRRAQQGVLLSELIWAIILTKRNLWDFLKQEAVLDRPAEISGELEVEELLDQFFDRAIYYAATGYEQSSASQAHSPMRTASPVG
jgi:hypothetical protein